MANLTAHAARPAGRSWPGLSGAGAPFTGHPFEPAEPHHFRAGSAAFATQAVGASRPSDARSAGGGEPLAATNVTDYTALLAGISWNGIAQAGLPCIVTFSFGATAPLYVVDGSGGFAPDAAASYEAFTAAEKTVARNALAQWAATCGIDFVEVAAGEGELTFHKVDLQKSPNPESGGFAITTTRTFFLSGVGVDMLESDGDIFIDAVTTPTGAGLAYTLLHEVGHTLGLKHPFEGDPQYPAATTSQTVLAYGAAVSALGTLDPQAARALYGANIPAANTLLNYSYNAATKTLTSNWGSAANIVMGTGQKDVVDAGDGNDRVAGFQNNDTLKGGAGDDQLFGGPGNDILIGGAGNDFLIGGNSIIADAGIDTADYSAATSPLTVQLRFFYNDAGFQATGAGIGNDQLYEIDNVIGGSGIDTLAGNQFANLLSGRAGNDILRGSLGADTLDGGTGADTMTGGIDNDIYVVDNGGDIADELNDGGDGADLVKSSISFSLADAVHAKGNIENLTLIGAANINGTGNSLANRIVGNSGNNSLNGGTGADTMEGAAGNDSYAVDNARDRVIEKMGEGVDTVNSSVSFTLHGQHIETLNLTGSGNIGGTGNSLANTITGNSRNNSIDGGAGADTLQGKAGSDIYFVDNAGDKVLEKTGEGTDSVNSSVSFTLHGQYIEKLVLTGTGNTSATGNSLANTLTGNAGNNVLNGMLGADIIDGKAGKDDFLFNSALGAGNADTLLNYSLADDSIQLENGIFTQLTTLGTLASTRFAANASGAATTSAHRIVYETDTGNLFYDADGNGAGTALLFATVAPGLAMTAGEFTVI